MLRAAALLLALVSACSQPPEAVPDAGTEPVDAGPAFDTATLAAEYARANCEIVLRCVPPAVDGLADCVRQLLGAASNELTAPLALQNAVLAGEVAVDTARVGDCLEALARADCDLLFAPEKVPACEGVFTPQRELDQSCGAWLACKGTATCRLASPDACVGTCVGGAAGGCTGDADCAPDGYCAPNGGQTECRPWVQEDGDCSGGKRCGPGLQCRNSGGQQKCVALALEGESCHQATCAEGLRCADLRGPPTCVAKAIEGERCGAGVTCAPGLACLTQVCRAPGGEGARCGVAGEPQCGTGLVCSANECVRLPADEGAACREGRCGADLFCDAITTLCRELPAPGNPCFVGACRSDGYCSGGLCVPRVADGGTCTSTATCAAGLLCRTGVGGTSRCAAPAELEETCLGDSDCVAGLVCVDATTGPDTCGPPLAIGAVCELA